jgi:hypothetical protein
MRFDPHRWAVFSIHVGVDVYRKVPFAIHADGRFLSLDELG